MSTKDHPSAGYPEHDSEALLDKTLQVGRISSSVTPYHLTPESSVIVRPVTESEDVQILSLERYLPAPHKPRGTALLTDPADFAAYVNRQADAAHTTVWADLDEHRVTALFNDHHGPDSPGWRDHSATLSVKADPDWSAWRGQDGELKPQMAFAEFIQDNIAAIIDPPAADMLEVATSFSSYRSDSFSQATRLSSGEVEMTYRQEGNAKAGKSRIEVPETFTLALAPFLGVGAETITARLRWRVRDGELRIGYKLHRPDQVEREAFERICGQLAEQITAPLYRGSAPFAVR